MTQDAGAAANEATVEWLMKPGAPDVATSVAELFDRPAWMDNAACRGEPVGTFFPERGQSVQRVRELCGGCPVRSECLSYAIEDRDTAGWWGGTSERARRNMLAFQRPAPRPQAEPTPPAAQVTNRKGLTAQGVGRVGTLTLLEFAEARGYDPTTSTYRRPAQRVAATHSVRARLLYARDP